MAASACRNDCRMQICQGQLCSRGSTRQKEQRMASVSFEKVEKAYGTTKVIHGVGFDIHDGEFMVLVAVRLRQVDASAHAGRARRDRQRSHRDRRKVVNDTESKDRDIAMV